MKRSSSKIVGAGGARCVMVLMFGLLTVFPAAGQEANKRIDTPDGLNMRDAPSITGTVLLTIPGGEIVSLIREEGNPVTIGDRTGKWTEVIWKNNRGWVFGGYLAAVKPDSTVFPIVNDVVYEASHSQGYKNTDAGITSRNQYVFSFGNRVTERDTYFQFDAKTILVYEGIFQISGKKINITFQSGIERKEIGPDFAPPDYEPTEKSVPGFNMTLIWVDELDGFMTEYSYNQVKSGNYILDRSSRQYKYETDSTFDYIGYYVCADLVLVEGGTFTMGDTAGGGDSDEKPTHSVTVSGFYMNKYETTQKEFQALMGFNPSYFSGDYLPVEQVTWYDAVAYCNARSQKEGLRQAYTITGISKNSDGNITSASVSADWSANGYRLPTEAEWEYAAKGGKLSKGYKYAGSNSEGGVAWYYGNSGSETQPVGTKSANELGVYDLSGNVWEWCWDWKGDYSSSSQTDPRGASSGTFRVDRGGSWGRGAGNLRSSYRGNYAPDGRYDNLGFRPVRSLR